MSISLAVAAASTCHSFPFLPKTTNSFPDVRQEMISAGDLLIRHLGKSQQDRAIYRLGLSFSAILFKGLRNSLGEIPIDC
jgi:hypothetical protein